MVPDFLTLPPYSSLGALVEYVQFTSLLAGWLGELNTGPLSVPRGSLSVLDSSDPVTTVQPEPAPSPVQLSGFWDGARSRRRPLLGLPARLRDLHSAPS